MFRGAGHHRETQPCYCSCKEIFSLFSLCSCPKSQKDDALKPPSFLPFIPAADPKISPFSFSSLFFQLLHLLKFLFFLFIFPPFLHSFSFLFFSSFFFPFSAVVASKNLCFFSICLPFLLLFLLFTCCLPAFPLGPAAASLFLQFVCFFFFFLFFFSLLFLPAACF